MISPDEFERLARDLVVLYRDVEQRVIADIARQLRRGLKDDDWASRRLLELTRLRQRVALNLRVLAKSTSDGARVAITEAWKAGELLAESELPEAEAPFAVRPSTAAIEALVAELSGKLSATHQRILRGAEDVYRTVIAEVVQAGLDTEFTRRTAAQAALDRFAVRGVSGFTDRIGRSWSLASYTEMAVRTGASNALLEAKTAKYAARGYDLVRISDAPGECGVCRPWEGKVVSLTGSTPGYPTLDDARAAGLFHPGCRHTYGLYVPGLSKPMGPTSDPEGDAARQQQRYLERGIRSWKMREAAALDESATRYAQAKQREWQQRLREHIDATGGKRLRYREQIKRAI